MVLGYSFFVQGEKFIVPSSLLFVPDEERRTKNIHPLVFGKDGWGGEALFGDTGVAVDVFFARKVYVRPERWPKSDDAFGPETFGDEVDLHGDLDAAAARRGFAWQAGHFDHRAAGGHL